MKTALRWTALSLFALVSVFLLWFGFTYASVNEPLWFHAAAVPEGARNAVRPLYFALMNLIGGSSLALGLLSLFTTLTAIRRGSRLAALAVSAAFAIAFVMAAITAEGLARATGAPTSWHLMGVLLALTAAALMCSIMSAPRNAC